MTGSAESIIGFDKEEFLGLFLGKGRLASGRQRPQRTSTPSSSKWSLKAAGR
jgi:hypothetical protein